MPADPPPTNATLASDYAADMVAFGWRLALPWCTLWMRLWF